MCSVCWHWGDDEVSSLLKILFNRDEQRSRALATPPEIAHIENTETLMPLDPARGGTWIATNEHGVTVALLNNYEMPPIAGKEYDSRGHVVKTLSSHVSLEQAEARLRELVSEFVYPAFSLLIWDVKIRAVKLFGWNEKELVSQEIEASFLTSSSWNTQEVQAYRKSSYVEAALKGDAEVESFMKTLVAEKEQWSVVMEREKTRTVSLSEISVSERETEFFYHDYNTSQSSEYTLERKVG